MEESTVTYWRRHVRKSWLPLAAVCVGSFLFLLDTTVVTVASPAIVDDLGSTASAVPWVLNIYTLVLAMLMLPMGGWADQLGHRRTFVAGLAVFAVASAGCAGAGGIGWLIALRAMQGVGGAAIAVTGFSLLITVYAGSAQLGRAMGVFFAVNGLGAATGPLLGGVLTDGLGWRSIFLLNIPLAILAAILVRASVPSSPRTPGRTDAIGVLLFALAAGTVTLGLSLASTSSWTDPLAAALVVLGLFSGAGFVFMQLRSLSPLLDVRLFARPSFTTAMATAAVSSVPFAMLVFTSVWLQDGHRFSPAQTGLALMPLAVVTFLVSTVAGKRLHDLPPRWPITTGLAAISFGAIWQASAGSDVWSIAPGLAITGVGIGLIGPTLGGAVATATPAGQAGMGAGAMTTFRQLGQTIGVAALGIVFGAPETAAQYTTSFHGAQIATAAVSLVAGLASFMVLPRIAYGPRS